MLNRWVLSRDRKTATEGAEVTRSGRLFRRRAAATGKARSPRVLYSVLSVLLAAGCGEINFIYYCEARLGLPVNSVVDKGVEVLAPCLAVRRCADHVLQQHVPTNDERPHLTHAHVTKQVKLLDYKLAWWYSG